MLKVIRNLADDGMTMMIVTHEMGFAAKVSDRVLFLADGCIEEQGPPAQLFHRPKSPRLQYFCRRGVSVSRGRDYLKRHFRSQHEAGDYIWRPAGACWGFIFLPPVLLPEISPLLLTCGRFATYGILAAILLIPQWRNIARVWHHRDLLTLIRLSLMSNVLYFLLVAVAVKQVGIAATSLVIGLIPVMVPVLGRRDQHAPPFRQLLLPMAAIIAGVVLINLHALQTSSHQVTEGKRQMLGMLCAFAALLCWSRYAVENSRCLKNLLTTATSGRS